MEYVYAALLLHETDEEINEENLTAVLDAAGVEVEESRVKALVAALEDVDIEEALETAAAVPAATGGGAAPSTDDAADDSQDDTDEADADAEEAEADDEEEEVSGEGLGDLFG